MGVWIEITEMIENIKRDYVHPRVGVWIEIMIIVGAISSFGVHPRVGVWIEIEMASAVLNRVKGFTPVWGCGLK